MTASARRAPATAPLLYWLTLVAGLAALTALRLDDLGSTAPLWAGSVLGSAVGQFFAWRRLRLWLVVVSVVTMAWLLVPIVAGLHVGQVFVLAHDGLLPCLAGAICGYASLTERGALVAFWFPAVPWMLAMLQGGERAALRGGISVVAFVGLGALFLAFLHARETRRVAIWEAHAADRLADAEAPVVLRTRPLRAIGRVAWIAALGAATLAVTASIAPELWGRERLSTGVATALRGSRPCCPEGDSSRQRVSEFLPLAPPHEDAHRSPACTACRHGVPVPAAHGAAAVAGSGVWRGGSGESAEPADGEAWNRTTSAGVSPAEPPAAWPPSGAPSGSVTTTPPAPPATSVAPAASVAITSPKSSPPPAPSAAAPSTPPVAPSPVLFTGSATSVELAPSPRRVEEVPLAELLQAAATLLAVGIALQLALRPLRRAVAIRHLRRPLWPEPVDQRVSNLWQLALVGLHDAGFRVAPGEQPRELARRVGLEGMATCATVLERARHGVRVDAADLEAMSTSAEAVYAAARRRAGPLARALASVRWPLS